MGRWGSSFINVERKSSFIREVLMDWPSAMWMDYIFVIMIGGLSDFIRYFGKFGY